MGVVSRQPLYWQLCIKTFHRCSSNPVRLTNIGLEGSQTINVAVIEGFTVKEKETELREKGKEPHLDAFFKDYKKLFFKNLLIK